MGRHRTQQEKQELGECARALRADGKSRRKIQAELGIGDDLAKALLRGVPLPDSLARPRAKDGDRDAAVHLRRSGMTYDQIAAELGVSKSSCSLWLRDVAVEGGRPAGCAPEVPDRDERCALARQLRVDGHTLRDIAARLGVSAKTAYYWTWDLPAPPRARSGGDRDHMAMMRRRYWDRVLAERAAERSAVVSAHAARITEMSERDVEIAAVVAYWCEGSKSKSYDRRERVTFINSDPDLILLFLTWLDQVAFPPEHRRYSVSIHASADVPGATAWWADLVGVDVERIGPPNLKRHNPKTVRKNVDEAYVGCLVVRLVQSRSLYQRIEGVWQGIMGALPVVQGS